MVNSNRPGSFAPWSNVAFVVESGFKAGAPGEIRTRGLRFRKPLTYRRARQKTAEHRRSIADLVAFRSSFDPFTGASCTMGKGLKMNEQYKVWCPDMGEDEDDCRLIMAYDEESAASEYVERSHNEEPFDCEMICHVRCTRGGSEVRKYAVVPEPSTTFYSREVV